MTAKKRVAVLLTHKDEVQLGWMADAAAVAQRHGLDLIELWAGDAMAHSRTIGSLVWKDQCDGLVILAKTSGGPTSLLREAVSRGKAVVMLNRTSSDMDPGTDWSWPSLRRDFPKVLSATVVPDGVETGRVQGRQFRALLPKGGTLLYVLGDPFSSDGMERLQGVEEILQGDHSFKMGKAVGGFEEEKAQAACEQWLRIRLADRGFTLDLIGSQSEAMVPGIRRALATAAQRFDRSELGSVPMTAVDGMARYKGEVDQGQLAATVDLPSRVAAAVQLMARFWQDGSLPAQPIISLSVASYPVLERLRPLSAQRRASASS